MYKVNMSVSYRHFKESTTRKNVEGGMALYTKGINRNVLKILILLIALQDNGMGAATPALQSISEAFPNAGYQLISMIVTLPALMLAIMPIFYPKLVQLFKKRWILIITAVLFLVGGVGPAFINSNIFIILLLRLLVGVACGIFMPLCIDLIVDFFEGNERAKMVGWSSTFTGFGGILFQTLGGYLASYHWSYCFFAFLVPVIFLLFPVIFLPEPMREKKLANRKVENQNITHQKVKTPFSVWITGFFLCLFWLFAYVIITNASTVLITEGIAAQSQVGLIFSFMTLGTVISSAFFGKLLEKMGYIILPLAMMVAAVSMFTAFMARSIGSFIVAMFLLGFSSGIVTPGIMERNTSLVRYEGATKAVSVSYLFLGIGSFISPYIFNNIGLDARGQMWLTAILFVATAVFLFIVNRRIDVKRDI